MSGESPLVRRLNDLENFSTFNTLRSLSFQRFKNNRWILDHPENLEIWLEESSSRRTLLAIRLSCCTSLMLQIEAICFQLRP